MVGRHAPLATKGREPRRPQKDAMRGREATVIQWDPSNQKAGGWDGEGQGKGGGVWWEEGGAEWWQVGGWVADMRPNQQGRGGIGLN